MREVIARVIQGRSEFISISGEAGIGKSRLVQGLRHYVQRLRRPVCWLEGTCRGNVAFPAYRPFAMILHQYFGWLPSDTARHRMDDIRRWLDARARERLLPIERTKSIGWFLTRLLGLPDEEVAGDRPTTICPGDEKHEFFKAVRDTLATIARRRPLVLVLNDLHNANPLSYELFRYLLKSLRDVPVLMIAVYRPYPDSPCQHLSKTASMTCFGRYTPIRLNELAASEVEETIRSLLNVDEVSPSLFRFVLGQAGGNPLFVREIVYALRDTHQLIEADGAFAIACDADDDIDAPEGVCEAVRSRVEGLRSELREILGYASVIGPVFRIHVLEALLGRRLDTGRELQELVDRGFLIDGDAYPEAEFSFRHALLQKAIYAMIDRDERTTLHRRVAEVIEAQHFDELEVFYVDLAEHYSSSGIAAKAAEYLLKAGQREAEKSADATAVVYYERALRWIPVLVGESTAEATQVLEVLNDIRCEICAHRFTNRCVLKDCAAAPSPYDDASLRPESPPQRR